MFMAYYHKENMNSKFKMLQESKRLKENIVSNSTPIQHQRCSIARERKPYISYFIMVVEKIKKITRDKKQSFSTFKESTIFIMKSYYKD